MKLRIGLAIAAFLVLSSAPARADDVTELSARRGHRAGACDGFHRCRCGVTAARKAGLPLSYRGFNLKRAVEWIRAFPRTVITAGAVGYVRHGGPSGHVFTVLSYSGGATAMVYDDQGTYERSIRGAVFVSTSGGARHTARTTETPTIF